MDIRIVAGSQYRYEDTRTTFISILEKIVIHPEFNSNTLESNIAIGFVR